MLCHVNKIDLTPDPCYFCSMEKMTTDLVQNKQRPLHKN
jgi:hypothetical protein